MRSMVARAWAPSPPGRSMIRAKAAWSPTTNVGTPHTACSVAARSCSARTVASSDPSSTAAKAASASTPWSARTLPTTSRSRRSRPWSWRAANRARCTSRNTSGAVSRTWTPDHQGDQAAVVVGRSQIGGSPSATWTWPSEKGTKVTSHAGPGGQPVEHVLVGVAGEGAAVVPGDGEGGHVRFNRRARHRSSAPARPASARRRRQTRRATRPDGEARPTAPPMTSLAWWILTWTRLAATTVGQAVPADLRPPAPAVGEDGGGAQRGAGVAAGEAGGERDPQVVGALELGDRARPLEQGLEPGVDQGRLDPEHDREPHRLRRRGRRSGGRGSRRAGATAG